MAFAGNSGETGVGAASSSSSTAVGGASSARHLARLGGPITCSGVDRQLLNEQGFVILRNVLEPGPELQAVREAYEVLVERQVAKWSAEGNSSWTTGAQPRLNLRPDPTLRSDDPGLELDEATAAAIEFWCHPNVQGTSSELLGVADAGVTEMMLMCSPQSNHGPARWHRDFSAEHGAPMQGYADDILEGGARYVQWNMALYDDEVLYVVPGSHVRLNTPEENAQLAMDDSVPLPGAVQAKLRAGDAVVYILPLLHWASDYSTKFRRTVHGGFSEFSYYPGLDSYLHTLSPTAQQVRETALKLSS